MSDAKTISDAEVVAYHERVEKRFERFDMNNRPRLHASLKHAFNRWVRPGVWMDNEEKIWIDVDWLLFAFELAPTTTNTIQVTAFAKAMLAHKYK